jgi:hypothetical protein
VLACCQAGPGRPLGPADRPCGICGLLGLWPLGRCRTGRVIPSVGGVPEFPALPVEEHAMIEVENLRKRYGERLAVDGLGFVAQPGIVTGFRQIDHGADARRPG